MTTELREDARRARGALPTTGLARIFLMNRQQWTVEEVSDATTGACSLVFSSQGIARRIHNYPVRWRELPDAALYALSWER